MKILQSASRILQQIDRNTGYKGFNEIMGKTNFSIGSSIYSLAHNINRHNKIINA